MDLINMADRLIAYVEKFNANCLDEDRESRLIPNSCASAWLRENIPLVDIPDKVVERAYYFRWWSFRKHLRETSDGFVVTEFLADVPWAGKHNTISCAAGHHFYEGRWIREPKYLDQYLRFWFEGGGAIRSYSFWVADAAYQRYLVTGDIEPLRLHFSDFICNYEEWEKSHSDESGLFWQVDDREGMEYSMGGTGLRPNINSYMYADARAIAAISRILDENLQARRFDEKADKIKGLMRSVIWDDDMLFFKTFVAERHRRIQNENYSSANDNAYLDQPLGLCPVPELFGYAPWYYGVMDDMPQRDNRLNAWKYILDPDYFAGTAGLATAPIKHPLFLRHHHHECAWDGPSWPFATSQALGAMARTLRNYCDSDLPITARDYMKLITQYAAAHNWETPEGSTIDWIDENYDPIQGGWIARARLHEWDDVNKERGQYYNHSSFCDLVISDVIGLQLLDKGRIAVHPLAVDWEYFRLENIRIQGHDVEILYDKDGSRYGRGAGLAVKIDGCIAGSIAELGRIECSI